MRRGWGEERGRGGGFGDWRERRTKAGFGAQNSGKTVSELNEGRRGSGRERDRTYESFRKPHALSTTPSFSTIPSI